MPSTFETNEPSLQELLDDIHRGKMQLPDFQRGWVWDDDHIRDLIASVSRSYPIGAVMFLETGGDGARFKPQLLEGVSLANPPSPKLLILDGQQRLTALYMSLRSGKPVRTRTDKGQPIERVYYLDMVKCLDESEDRLDAIVSLPPDRMRRTDFNRKVELDVSTQEKEFAANYYPLALVYDTPRHLEWIHAYNKYYQYAEANIRLVARFDAEIVRPFHLYRLPVIELLRDTPKEAVCHVFEKVNTGGVALTVFELVTATFAADDFQLRKDWDDRAKRLRKYPQLAGVQASDFLTSVTLLASYWRNRTNQSAVSCKRKDVLRLTLDEYRQFADSIERGMLKAANLLMREKVFDARSLPYQTQLIPLAAICAALDNRFDVDSVKKRLIRWYWSGVFGELYGGANESRYANDIQDVIAWLDGGSEPRTIRDSSFVPSRLLTMQSRLSAAYKGVAVELMQVGSQDFISGDPIELTSYFETAVDIHHIFPRAYCERQGLNSLKWNSVVNKTALSARSNRELGGNKPSIYLDSIQSKYGLDSRRLDAILKSHLIDPHFLRQDDFDRFIQHRACGLLDLIEQATGKAVTGRDSEETIKTFGVPLVTEYKELQ